MPGSVQTSTSSGSSAYQYGPPNAVYPGPRPGTVVTGRATTLADIFRALEANGSEGLIRIMMKKVKELNPALTNYPPNKALPAGTVVDVSGLADTNVDTSAADSYSSYSTDSFQPAAGKPPVALNASAPVAPVNDVYSGGAADPAATTFQIALSVRGQNAKDLEAKRFQYMDPNVADYVCCANFASSVLQQAGLINQHANGVWGLKGILSNPNQPGQFKNLGGGLAALKNAKPGDVVLFSQGGDQHVEFFAGFDKNGLPLFIGSNNDNKDGSQRISVEHGPYWNGQPMAIDSVWEPKGAADHGNTYQPFDTTTNPDGTTSADTSQPGHHMLFVVGQYDDDGNLTGFNFVGGLNIQEAMNGTASSGQTSGYTTSTTSNKGDPSTYFLTQNKTKWNLGGSVNGNCGPTTLAMAALALGHMPPGTSSDPAHAEALIENVRRRMTGADNIGAGTDVGQLIQGARSLGLSATDVGTGLTGLTNALEQGKMAAVCGNPSAYGAHQGWHWILVCGVQKDSAGHVTGYIINDPVYTGRPGVVITPQQMQNYIYGHGDGSNVVGSAIAIG